MEILQDYLIYGPVLSGILVALLQAIKSMFPKDENGRSIIASYIPLIGICLGVISVFVLNGALEAGLNIYMIFGVGITVGLVATGYYETGKNLFQK